MEIIISEKSFLDIKKISSIKTYISKLGEYKLLNNELKGSIFLDLSISDNDGSDIFLTKEIPLTIIISEDKKVNNLDIKSINLELIDSWGINVYYELILSLSEDDEIDGLSTENIENSNDCIVDTKEDNVILDDEVLVEDNNVEIITTSSNLDEFGFVDFFNNYLDKTYSIKTIRVDKEDNLNALSVEYNKPIEELYKGYDKDLGIVMIYLND